MRYTEIMVLSVIKIAGGLGLIVLGTQMVNTRFLLSFGSRIRGQLVENRNNPGRLVLSGAAVTSCFQSNTGLTVLLMSMANVALVNLRGAFFVFVGTGLGQALSVWILSAAVFALKHGEWMLSLTAAAAVLSFVRYRPASRMGKGILGFLVILVGMTLILAGLPNVSSFPAAADFIGSVNKGLLIILAFLTGVLLSFLTRTSQAVVGFSLCLGISGWMPPVPVLTMLLGINLGNLPTLYRVSKIYGGPAKNFLSLVIVRMIIVTAAGFILVAPFILFFNKLPWNLYSWPKASPLFVAAGYSLYAVISALLCTAGASSVISLAERVIFSPGSSRKEEEDRLPILSRKIPDSQEANLITTRNEIGRMADLAHSMLLKIMNASQDMDGAKSYLRRILELNATLNFSESLVSRFFSSVIREQTGSDQANDITAQITVSLELRRIADACVNVAEVLERIVRKKRSVGEPAMEYLFNYIARVLDFVRYDADYLSRRLSLYDETLALKLEEDLGKERKKLSKQAKKTLEQDDNADIWGEFQFMHISYYLENIGDSCLSISREIPKLR